MPTAIESYVGKKRFKDWRECHKGRWVKSSYLLFTSLRTHTHDRPLKNKSNEHTVLELRWTCASAALLSPAGGRASEFQEKPVMCSQYTGARRPEQS